MSAHNIKKLRAQFKEQGKFHTPPELVELIANIARTELRYEPNEVYDPTCGAGDLLSAFPNAIKYGQDIDRTAAQDAFNSLEHSHVVVGDVLKEPAWVKSRFRCIVANPPFSIAWEPNEQDERFAAAPTVPTKSKADYAFILHILHMLDDGGVAVVMGFPGILYRGGREGKIRQWLVEQNVISRIFAIPGGHFEDTAIATCILVLRKDKKATGISFHDLEHGISRHVMPKEIAANDFNLSVSAYVQPPEPEKEPVIPWDLQQQARKQSITQLKKDLIFDRMVCELEGWDHEIYRQEILAALNDQTIIELRKPA